MTRTHFIIPVSAVQRLINALINSPTELRVNSDHFLDRNNAYLLHNTCSSHRWDIFDRTCLTIIFICTCVTYHALTNRSLHRRVPTAYVCKHSKRQMLRVFFKTKLRKIPCLEISNQALDYRTMIRNREKGANRTKSNVGTLINNNNNHYSQITWYQLPRYISGS